MAATFRKAPEARQLEARERARRFGVRVKVVVEGRRYRSRSQGEPGAIRTIERTRHGWACDCKGFAFTGVCKHVAAVQRRAEREGWAFGTLAAPADVAPKRAA